LRECFTNASLNLRTVYSSEINPKSVIVFRRIWRLPYRKIQRVFQWVSIVYNLIKKWLRVDSNTMNFKEKPVPEIWLIITRPRIDTRTHVPNRLILLEDAVDDHSIDIHGLILYIRTVDDHSVSIHGLILCTRTIDDRSVDIYGLILWTRTVDDHSIDIHGLIFYIRTVDDHSVDIHGLILCTRTIDDHSVDIYGLILWTRTVDDHSVVTERVNSLWIVTIQLKTRNLNRIPQSINHQLTIFLIQ